MNDDKNVAMNPEISATPIDKPVKPAGNTKQPAIRSRAGKSVTKESDGSITVTNLRDTDTVFNNIRLKPKGEEGSVITIPSHTADAVIQSPVIHNYIRLGWIEMV